MAAARQWARGGGEDGSKAIANATVLGLPEEAIEALRKRCAPSEPLEIWPENWPVIEAFLLVNTQWSVGYGGLIGLRYESVEAALRMLRIKPAEVFGGLRIMETEVLKAFSETRH